MGNLIRTILFLSAFAASVFSASAQTALERFMLGNNAYNAGDYARAEENYRAAIDGGSGGAELYYNLANALAKQGKKGDALLNYKRAVYNAPRMREAAANLEMFAKDNSLDSGLGGFSIPAASELSETEWTLCAFAAFWIAVLLILVPPLFGKRTMPAVFLAIVCASLFVYAVLAVRDWESYADTAVALKADSPLRISPTPTAPISAVADEGQCAKISKRCGDYFYLETPTGKKGWAAKADFSPVAE